MLVFEAAAARVRRVESESEGRKVVGGLSWGDKVVVVVKGCCGWRLVVVVKVVM